MLSITFSEFKKCGCPNCGCDSVSGSWAWMYGQTTGKCRHCGLTYEIRNDNITKDSNRPKYLNYIQIVTDVDKEYTSGRERHMEEAIIIKHPRTGMDAWHWEPEDKRPESAGEYVKSRGVGYDLAMFVKSKAAGERIIKLVKKVLDKDEIDTWLDYRPNEPTWIQVKFAANEFDLDELHKLVVDGVLTENMLEITNKNK